MPNIIEITDIAAPQLDPYVRLTEAQLKNRLHPEDGLFIAESPKVIGYALDAGYAPVSLLMERRHIGGKAAALLARFGDIPVYTAGEEVLRSLTGYPLTRGVLCAMRRRPLPTVKAVCDGAKRVAVLESIVDTTNIGAIFRSAAALGVDGVLLTPTTCDPLNRRAVRVNPNPIRKISSSTPVNGIPRRKAWKHPTANAAIATMCIITIVEYLFICIVYIPSFSSLL